MNLRTAQLDLNKVHNNHKAHKSHRAHRNPTKVNKFYRSSVVEQNQLPGKSQDLRPNLLKFARMKKNWPTLRTLTNVKVLSFCIWRFVIFQKYQNWRLSCLKKEAVTKTTLVTMTAVAMANRDTDPAATLIKVKFKINHCLKISLLCFERCFFGDWSKLCLNFCESITLIN